MGDEDELIKELEISNPDCLSKTGHIIVFPEGTKNSTRIPSNGLIGYHKGCSSSPTLFLRGPEENLAIICTNCLLRIKMIFKPETFFDIVRQLRWQ